eukprot:TRINITY_DN2644_c0_g1_i5.p1 TRINITY_DN2644_c0_g1~~TRINITY_DN2644_c0_g1_i5.p1  ORF type:complete len:114 (-),score=20.05 TRINITY_DN2644_c0_g1_i5:184-525(-)
MSSPNAATTFFQPPLPFLTTSIGFKEIGNGAFARSYPSRQPDHPHFLSTPRSEANEITKPSIQTCRSWKQKKQQEGRKKEELTEKSKQERKNVKPPTYGDSACERARQVGGQK